MGGRLEQGTEGIFWLWDAFVPGQWAVVHDSWRVYC